MPRLRRLKDYEQLGERLSELRSESDGSVETDPDGSDDGEAPVTGQSYLSNSSIIASMDDARLRQGISYHKQMARLFEEEYLGRLAGSRTRSDSCDQSWFEASHPYSVDTRQASRRLVRARRSVDREKGGNKKKTNLSKALTSLADLGYDPQQIITIMEKLK